MPRRVPTAGAVVLVLVTGFAAAACLLTGLLLEDDGVGRGDGALFQAVRVAWVLAAAALTGIGAAAWAGRWARAGRASGAQALLVAVASTAAWTGAALAAGWDPVR